MEKYFNFIKDLADRKIEEFMLQGHATPGNNGPYVDKESPIRNTAHWLVTYSYLWKKTQDEKYKNIINVFLNYLLLDEHYGENNAVKCRYKDNMDDTNGVIGPAWVIEGLLAAYSVLGNRKAIEKATKIFYSQKYNYSNHVWEIYDTKQRGWGMDRTYNHQLWFAASGNLILDFKEDSEIVKQISDFLDNYDKLLAVHRNGLFYHQANCRNGFSNNIKFNLRKIFCELSHSFKIKSSSFNIIMLEQGYHLFDLFGFALLSDRFGNHPVYQSKKLRNAINYACSEKHVQSLLFPKKVDYNSDSHCKEYTYNEYAFGYNSPAFEYPFVAKKLKGNFDKKIFEELWNEQITKTFSYNNNSFTKGNHDPNTLSARIYELVRYLEIENR